MQSSQRPRHVSAGLMILAAFWAGTTLTGCQFNAGGQTLPSPYYLHDDVQYFPAGPEFKLSREAAALDEARTRVQNGPTP